MKSLARSTFEWLCSLAMFLLLTACTDDSIDSHAIVLQSSAAIELSSVTGQEETIMFEASAHWTANCSSSWLTFSPRQGEKGSNSIILTTTAPNRTKANRSTQLTITSGSNRKSITIVQSSKYAVFNPKEYTIDADGGRLSLSITSNMGENDRLQVGFGDTTWISPVSRAQQATRSDWNGSLPLQVKPNTSTSVRTAPFFLMTNNGNHGWLTYDTAYVRQLGLPDDYESTDYSADGTVSLLQQASRGNGIPVVMMGDGFSDRDIAEGTYRNVMEKAVENMFSEEPAKSLRDYFDVYCVTAVSRHANIGSDYSTAFSSVPSISSTDIACDDEKVRKYVEKVDGINIENALAVVILNTNSYNGVTYLYSNGEQPIQFAVALCPIIYSLDSETFRQVLVHEAIGHGLGKLADEYGYTSNGSISEDEAKQLEAFHDYNWMKNVDVNNTPDLVVWSAFIGDNSFSNEAIGVYEGAYTFNYGVYRPTEESMMRSNHSPFNAPSRKAIYDRIMLLGEGRSPSTNKEFAAFDERHKPTQWNYAETRNQQSQQRQQYFAPPRIKQKVIYQSVPQ